MIIMRSFKYRLYPTLVQEQRMFQVLAVCRNWYNMCLEDRKLAWEFEKRSISKNDQIKQSRLYRCSFPQAAIVSAQTLQSVAIDLSKAFDAFFRRIKAGETPGYPRFKGKHHFHSFCFPQWGFGIHLNGRRLKLFGIGRVAVRWHRPLAGRVKTTRILHKAGKWYACFACEIEAPLPRPATGEVIGIDVGISALITTSTGEKIENPNYYRTAQKKLRRLQRKLARAQRGSKNRQKVLLQVQRQQEHVANQRRDYLHKLSSALIQLYDGIALEDLKIKNMVKNHHLSKSILDSGWSIFRQYLTYKAESAGREIAFVDPAYTSKTCSNCGAIFENLTLKDRWVECECGLSLDRDHNAAINILNRALYGQDVPVPQNVGH